MPTPPSKTSLQFKEKTVLNSPLLFGRLTSVSQSSPQPENNTVQDINWQILKIVFLLSCQLLILSSMTNKDRTRFTRIAKKALRVVVVLVALEVAYIISIVFS